MGDAVNITLNKNCVPGDRSAITPGGVRLGAPALTTRGFKEDDFRVIAKLLDRAVKISQKIQSKTGSKLKDFVAGIRDEGEVKELKREVNVMASKFPMPGFDVEGMKYREVEGPME